MTTLASWPMLSMPGSFSNEYDLPQGHLSCKSVFIPPQSSPRPTTSRTPKSTRSITVVSRPSLKSGESTRKRPRIDGRLSSAQSSYSAGGPSRASSYFNIDGSCDWPSPGLDDSVHSFEATSPPPLVNTVYKFAGGLDSPSAAYEERLAELGDREEQLDWRVNRYTSERNEYISFSSTEASYITAAGSKCRLPRTPSAVSVGGRKRLLDSSASSIVTEQDTMSGTMSGWHLRSKAWALTGGLAVKAINFCWNTAFRGFSAGGGQAYQLDVGTPEILHQGLRMSQIHQTQDVFSQLYEAQAESLPGGFPGDFSIASDMTSQRLNPSMREENVGTPTLGGRHEGPDGSTLRHGWTVVDSSLHQHNLDDEDSSPRKHKSRASVAGARARAFSYHEANTVNRPLSSRDSGSGASFASPRSKSSHASSVDHQHGRASVTSPSRQHSYSHSRSYTASYSPRTKRPSTRPAQSTSSASSRRQSSASILTTTTHLTQPAGYGQSCSRPQSPTKLNTAQASPTTQVQTPTSMSAKKPTLTPELVQYKSRLRRKQKQTDQSMARMNAQMQDLIRQGREALGSRIVIVDDDHVGAGACDDDHDSGYGYEGDDMYERYTDGYGGAYFDDHDMDMAMDMEGNL